MIKVFLSYRRSDSQLVADRLHDHLLARVGDEGVFKDIGDIPAGMDFREVLDTAVEDADVMLVVIGPEWLTVTDESGRRRLDDPRDFVRLEVESGLERVPIVTPVLVMGAEMPGENDLPPSLAPLAFRQGLQLRPDPDFLTDIERLCEELGIPRDPLHDRRERSILRMAIGHLPSLKFAMITTGAGAAMALLLGVRDSDPRLAIYGPLTLVTHGIAWLTAAARAGPTRIGALASAWVLATIGVLGTTLLASAFVNPTLKPFLKPAVFQIVGTAVAAPAGEFSCAARDSTSPVECSPVAGVEAFILYENDTVFTDESGNFSFRLFSRDYEVGNTIIVRLTHPDFVPRSATGSLRGALVDLEQVELRRKPR